MNGREGELKTYYRPSIIEYTAWAWFGLALFLVCSLVSWINGELIATLFFLFFVALGVLMLAIAVRVEINRDAIIVNSIFTKYRIAWNEIESVETGSWVCVFHGKGKKRLVVPTSWSGQQAASTFGFVDKQIALLGIKVTNGLLADYKIHKNVWARD